MKETQKDARTIGQELGVRYVVEGSARKAGNRLRITVQLIDSIDDRHLWAQRYDGTLDDVFDIQEKVARWDDFHPYSWRMLIRLSASMMKHSHG